MTIPPRLRDRPTPDLIVFALTAVVIFVVLSTSIILLVNALFYPERDDAQLSMRIGQIVSSLIAAIVGYMAGRGVNGKGENHGKAGDT